jgi:hypothetical protein
MECFRKEWNLAVITLVNEKFLFIKTTLMYKLVFSSHNIHETIL